MNEIFEIAGRIGTPLGLAGFFGAVFFFIFRQVLRNPNTPERFVSKLLNWLCWLCLLAMVLGFLGYITDKHGLALVAQGRPTDDLVLSTTGTSQKSNVTDSQNTNKKTAAPKNPGAIVSTGAKTDGTAVNVITSGPNSPAINMPGGTINGGINYGSNGTNSK